MNNFWAIAVGINQYQNFQPLGYAQRDASLLHHFFVEEVGIPADHCTLLTEISPSINPHAVYPDGANIRAAIAQTCQQQVQPGDILWVFFSGYGVRFQGQDYLVPIDGHPEQIPTTAIAIDNLMTLLRNTPTRNIIVVLDINRSQGAIDGQRVGLQIADLAERYGISTILSCQHDQFSHETLALRHSFFTATLLEGLRYERCVTLDALTQYLSQRLPELTDHHWRPRQDPLAIVSLDQKYELIVPKEIALVSAPNRPTPELPTISAGAAESPGSDPVLPSMPPSAPPSFTPPSATVPNSSSNSTPPSNSTTAPRSRLSWDWLSDPFWRQFLSWGSLMVLALLAGVLIVNRDDLLVTSSPTAIPSDVPASADEMDAVADMDGESGAVTGADALNRAMLDEAIASLVSPRAESPVNQATDFRRAINLAQRIPNGEPFYDEAQEYIRRWSLIIHDFALARAAQGNYRAAIATSQLIPIDQTELQQTVADTLPVWQQGAANQDILDRAKALTRSQQASSYNEAIALARRIPAGQPLHGQAQTLVMQWSQDIFTLARARAGQNNFQGAIETAALVPEGTPLYGDAQAAIEQWRSQLNAES